MVDTSLLSVRVAYKIFPLAKADPALSNAKETWLPVMKVAIVVGHATSKRFEAIVDSGSAVSLFHADIGKALGLKLKDGYKGVLGGVVGGSVGEVYYHPIKLKLLADIIPITAGFSDKLTVAAILGRHGFFEHFTVTFDPCNNPPSLVVERFHKA